MADAEEVQLEAADTRHIIPAGEADFQSLFGTMFSALWHSPLRNRLIVIVGVIFVLVVVTAVGQLLLNQWNQPFYDALQRRDLPGFLHQLVVFAQIAGVLLVFNVAQGYFNQLLHIRLRQGLVANLLDEWLKPGRAARLAESGELGQNPDQRLHEDARKLCDLTADLLVGLLQSTVLLVSFITVLWSSSTDFAVNLGGRTFAIPGYMVWAALLYAGVASGFGWLIGRPLIRLNSDRYAQEAQLRALLIRVSDEAPSFEAPGSGSTARRRLEREFRQVIIATRAIMSAAVRLLWFTAGYGWVTVVAPVVIASPVYFAGDLSFGGLMMAAAAFTQVHSALRWFVDNIGGIADWRATLLRVGSFRLALLRMG